uniref:C2H2-type domain-containing protein n=1 Tax=Trichuris muris TaxID=70415 RepID=A0A5S6QBW0_TRIMR
MKAAQSTGGNFDNSSSSAFGALQEYLDNFHRALDCDEPPMAKRSVVTVDEVTEVEIASTALAAAAAAAAGSGVPCSSMVSISKMAYLPLPASSERNDNQLAPSSPAQVGSVLTSASSSCCNGALDFCAKSKQPIAPQMAYVYNAPPLQLYNSCAGFIHVDGSPTSIAPIVYNSASSDIAEASRPKAVGGMASMLKLEDGKLVCSSSQQMLIPLGQSDGSGLQAGNTVLLPIVPTILPDGNLDMRVAGMSVPCAHEKPLSPPQQQSQASMPTTSQTFILLINGANGSTSNATATNEQQTAAATAMVTNALNVVSSPKTLLLVEGVPQANGSDAVIVSSGTAVGRNRPGLAFSNCADKKMVGSEKALSSAQIGDAKNSDVVDAVCIAPVQPGATYRCEFCDYSNQKRYLLARHMKSHSEDRPFKCSMCDRSFKTNSSLQNHINTHKGFRPHQCKRCELAFTTSGELIRHIRYRHTLEKPHKCTQCTYASVELSKLKRHMRSHTGERPYQCVHCSYASPDTYKLKRHMRVHTGEKPYQCEICQQRFTQSNSLKAHKIIHSGARPVFYCKYCPSSCGRKTDLRIHVQKLHTSVEHPLLCKKCNKTFPDRYSFKVHQKLHDGERCFPCDRCPYSASSQNHLEAHLSTHYEARPFKCTVCDQSFRQVQMLKRHVNTKHNPNYVKPPKPPLRYVCERCDKGFAFWGNLKRHTETHVLRNNSGATTMLLSSTLADAAKAEMAMPTMTSSSHLANTEAPLPGGLGGRCLTHCNDDGSATTTITATCTGDSVEQNGLLLALTPPNVVTPYSGVQAASRGAVLLPMVDDKAIEASSPGASHALSG